MSYVSKFYRKNSVRLKILGKKWKTTFCPTRNKIFRKNCAKFCLRKISWLSQIYHRVHISHRYAKQCGHALFQKLSGGAGSKLYGMDFSRSHEGKKENPRDYNGFCNRERKNTFHITLNHRQLLSFGTVCVHKSSTFFNLWLSAVRWLWSVQGSKWFSS